MKTNDLESRAAADADVPAIIDLLRQSMGRQEDARFEDLFRWKHLENAFGRSPMWVACVDGRVVGLRTFMRWEFERGDQIARCVRAVDTATHPDFQGRGIFSRLTTDALPVMAADGVEFVFNTPNAQSLPGYLKMGWREIGRAGAYARPLSLGGAARLVRSRVPASHWSEPNVLGEPVGDVLADAGFGDLLASRPVDPERFRTRCDLSFLGWRYGHPSLRYRALVAPGGISEGVAFVRLRRRGAARELVLAALFVPGRSRSARRALLRRVVRTGSSDADYALGVGSLPGWVPLPARGPVMTTRDLSANAPESTRAFDLSLGDIELF